ncbi:MAG: glycosyltransferase family 88 protein [Rickettsiales bacterium]
MSEYIVNSNAKFENDFYHSPECIGYNTGIIPKEGDHLYLDTSKLYKIWFNKNPDEFLSEKNLARLIKFRSDNPCSKINIIYSESLLSAKTKEDNQKFLTSYNIEMVDFDKIFNDEKVNLQSEGRDLEIFALARDELDNFNKGNGGGNPAAASDLLRISFLLNGKYGIYSDFDVDISFGKEKKFIEVKSPIIIPENTNGFIATATEKDSIHKNAQDKLMQYQNTVIHSYNFGNLWTLKNLANFKNNLEKNLSITNLTLPLLRKYIKEFNAYDYMELFCDKLPENYQTLKVDKVFNQNNELKLFVEVFTNNKCSYFSDFFTFNRDNQQGFVADKRLLAKMKEKIELYNFKDTTLKEDIINYQIPHDATRESPYFDDFDDLLQRIAKEIKPKWMWDKVEDVYKDLVALHYIETIKSKLYKDSLIKFSGNVISDTDARAAYEDLSANGWCGTDARDNSWDLT